MIVVIALVLCMSREAYPAGVAPLDDLTVLARGALDGRAVVKTADGKMHVLKVGDAIPGTGATIRQVHTDKRVVEEKVTAEGALPAPQTVWVHKPAKPGEKSQVQRMSSQAPAPQVIQQETSQFVDPAKPAPKPGNQ